MGYGNSMGSGLGRGQMPTSYGPGMQGGGPLGGGMARQPMGKPNNTGFNAYANSGASAMDPMFNQSSGRLPMGSGLGRSDFGGMQKPMGMGMLKTYENAPNPTQLLPGQSYPGFGGRYGPDQHQPGRGTPNTATPGFIPPGSGPTWPGMITSQPPGYGPDQHQPNRGTPNTTTQGGTPWTPGPTWPGMITSPQMSDPFTQTAPNPQQAQPAQAQPAQQMIPGTNRPMPPGAFIDEYGIARRAPETPMNPAAGQFGAYQNPAGDGFTGIRNGQNLYRGHLWNAQGMDQGGNDFTNWLNYMGQFDGRR